MVNHPIVTIIYPSRLLICLILLFVKDIIIQPKTIVKTADTVTSFKTPSFVKRLTNEEKSIATPLNNNNSPMM